MPRTARQCHDAREELGQVPKIERTRGEIPLSVVDEARSANHLHPLGGLNAYRYTCPKYIISHIPGSLTSSTSSPLTKRSSCTLPVKRRYEPSNPISLASRCLK